MGSSRPPLQGQQTGQGQQQPKPQQQAVPDVKWIVDQRKKKAPEYAHYRGYYDGTGQLAMITDKQRRTVFGKLFQYFSANHCAPPVDAVADRLQQASFSAPEEEQHEREMGAAKREMEKRDREKRKALEQGLPEPEPPTSSAEATTSLAEPPPEQKIQELEKNLEDVPKASEEAQDIWEENIMDLQIGQIFEEALSTGNAYAIVWPTPEGDDVVIYPQAAHEVYVEYDSNRPGKITKAGKCWSEKIDTPQGKKDGFRVNLYYEDRIEKYAAPSKEGDKSWPDPKFFKPYDDGDGTSTPNRWGIVPVFHFANKRRLGLNEEGKSELRNAIHIQNAQNRELWRLLIAGEYDITKQKYVVNMADPTDPANDNGSLQSGPDMIMAFQGTGEEGSNPQVGEFSGADVIGFQTRVNIWRETMAIATQTPVQYFMPTQEGPATPASGESQKVADTKLTKKVRDRQIAWGTTIAKMMELAVKMQRDDATAEVTLKVNWEDTTPRNELEIWQVAQLQSQAGVPWQQILRERGYNEDQIESFEHQKEENAAKFQQAPVAGNFGPQGKDVEQAAQQQTAKAAANDAAKQALESQNGQGTQQGAA